MNTLGNPDKARNTLAYLEENQSSAMLRSNHNSDSNCYGNGKTVCDDHSYNLSTQDSNNASDPTDLFELIAESTPSKFDNDSYVELSPDCGPNQEREPSTPTSATNPSVTNSKLSHQNDKQETLLETGKQLTTPSRSLHTSATSTDVQVEEMRQLLPNIASIGQVENQNVAHEVDDDDLFGPEPVMEPMDPADFQAGDATDKDHGEIAGLVAPDSEEGEATQASPVSQPYRDSCDSTLATYGNEPSDPLKDQPSSAEPKLLAQESRTCQSSRGGRQFAHSSANIFPSILENEVLLAEAEQQPNSLRTDCGGLDVQLREHEIHGLTSRTQPKTPSEVLSPITSLSTKNMLQGRSGQVKDQPSQPPISPPQSDTEESYDLEPGTRQAQMPSGNEHKLPSPPSSKETASGSRGFRESRQSSPVDYEGSLDLDQLPIHQLSQLQLEAQAKIMIDTYKSSGEKAKDPNLQSSLDYLAQLNPESQVLWLSQQPSTVKQRATCAVNAFKNDAESRRVPNIEADLAHLAALDPKRQLAYLQWPGAQPVAREALAAFESEIEEKGWPLDRFKELYLMSSEEQVNYLYERMEFWPGFAKQYGLTSRPSNSDPKWEGRWPESPRIENGGREVSPLSTCIPGISLTTNPDRRSNSTYVAPPLQSPVHQPPSPKEDVVNLPRPSSNEVASTPATSSSAKSFETPPISSHLFTSSGPALVGQTAAEPESLIQKGGLLMDRSKPPVPPERDQAIRQSLEPINPHHFRLRESSPPYEDRSAAPSPPTSVDISMEDAPPVPPLNPSRTRPENPEARCKTPSSPDIITTSVATVPSPSKIASHSAQPDSVSKSPTKQAAPSTPSPSSVSRSRSPIKGQATPRRLNAPSVQTSRDGAPSIPKRSDRRKSLGVANSKVEKTRKATQGNGSSVRDAVSKIEAGLKKERECGKEGSRDSTPRRSERIRLRKERDSTSPSPGI